MSEFLVGKSVGQDFTPTRVAHLLWAMASMNPEHLRSPIRGPLPIEARRLVGYPPSAVGNTFRWNPSYRLACSSAMTDASVRTCGRIFGEGAPGAQ